MTKSSKTAIILTTTLVIVGVGGYLVYTYLIKPAKNKKESNVDKATNSDSTTSASTPSSTTPSGTTVSTTTSGSSEAWKPTTFDEITAFQNWLNKNHAGWATGYTGGVVNSGSSGYGNFGSLTQSAWNQWGGAYVKTLDFQNKISSLNNFMIGDIVKIRKDVYNTPVRKVIRGNYVTTSQIVNLSNKDFYKIVDKTILLGNPVYVFQLKGYTHGFFLDNGNNLIYP